MEIEKSKKAFALNKVEIALRNLVKQMYHDLHGAYGGEFYEGQFEKEIQAVMDAIKGKDGDQ